MKTRTLFLWFSAAFAWDVETDPYGVVPRVSDFEDVGGLCKNGWSAGTCITSGAQMALQSYIAFQQRSNAFPFGAGKRWKEMDAARKTKLASEETVATAKNNYATAKETYRAAQSRFQTKQADVEIAKANKVAAQETKSAAQEALKEAKATEDTASRELQKAAAEHKGSWACSSWFGNQENCQRLTQAKTDAEESVKTAASDLEQCTKTEAEVSQRLETAGQVLESLEQEYAMAAADVADAAQAVSGATQEFKVVSQGLEKASQTVLKSLKYWQEAGEEVCLWVTAGGCGPLIMGLLIFTSGGQEVYASWRDAYQAFDAVTTKLSNAENDFLNFVGKVAATPAVIGLSTHDWLVTSLTMQADRSHDIVDEIVAAITDIQRNNDDVETSWYCWLIGHGCILVPLDVLDDLRSAKSNMLDYRTTVDQAKSCIDAKCQASTMQFLMDQKGDQLHSVCISMQKAACAFGKAAEGHASSTARYCSQTCSQSKFQTKINGNQDVMIVTLVEMPPGQAQWQQRARSWWQPTPRSIRLPWALMVPCLIFSAILTAKSRKRDGSGMLRDLDNDAYGPLLQ